MATLPQQNGNYNTWGTDLINWLLTAHKTDGTLKAVYSVGDFGAIGDGLTDDTTAIQKALDAVGNAGIGTLLFPTATYLISGTLLYTGAPVPNEIIINGCGSTLKVKTGTGLTTPAFASKDWYNNSSTCGNPIIVRDLRIDGNSATSGSGAHGFVGFNFWSIFDNIFINNVTGDGFLFSAQSRNGTHISNTCVEAKIRRIQIRTSGGAGIHVQDSGSPLNSCTDGFLEDCIVTAAGGIGINVEMGPGWAIQGNHVYGTVADAISISKCYATRVMGNYIDGYGSGSSTFIAGIGMDIINGRGSSCIGNHVGFENGTATGPYQAVRITGKGSATSVCVVMGNTVIGGSQSGSIAYAYQAQGSQVGQPFFVYSHDNDSRAVATRIYQDNNTSGGDLVILGHIGSENPNAPLAAAGANAGTSPPAPVLTGCTDLAGKITFGTGTSPAAGAMVILTFNVAYANAPKVVLSPINSASASLNFYVSSTTTTFTVSCVNAPSASQGNATYGFFYHVLI